MRVTWLAVGLAVLGAAVAAAGCAPTSQGLVREYNHDGLELYGQGSYARAAETFEAGLKLQPSDPSLLFNAGRSYEQGGDVGRAETLYRTCLQVDPKNLECRKSLVSLMVRTGRRPEATEMVENWLAGNPRAADHLVADGYLWAEAGDLPRAQARLQQALEIDPRNTHALVELGDIYERLNRPDRALALYEKALDVSPNLPAVTERVRRLRDAGAGKPRPDAW